MSELLTELPFNVIRLVSYSKPSDDFEAEGLENVQDLIAFCARVSNPGNQFNTLTAEKLIKYLINHSHWSPLEMVNACLEIETTRDISHQIVRHRSFSFQEFSQRYADPTKDMKFYFSEARLQDPKNRQNSVEVDDDDLQLKWDIWQENVVKVSQEAYNWAIDQGIAKEVARKVLPEGLTGTRLYMNGTIRSWVHYINLRGGHGTQKEHKHIAKYCAKVISEIFPLMNDL